MPDRLHSLGATVTQTPAREDIAALVARIARLWAELHLADPLLAAELAHRLPTMEITDAR